MITTYLLTYELIHIYFISLIQQYLASIIYKPPKYQRWMVTYQYWNNQSIVLYSLLVHKYKVRKKMRRRMKYSLKGSLECGIQDVKAPVVSSQGAQYHHKPIFKGSHRLSDQVEFVTRHKQPHKQPIDRNWYNKWFRHLTVPLSIFMLTYFGNVSSYVLHPTYFRTNIPLKHKVTKKS
jgi:hypothetical protein